MPICGKPRNPIAAHIPLYALPPSPHRIHSLAWPLSIPCQSLGSTHSFQKFRAQKPQLGVFFGASEVACFVAVGAGRDRENMGVGVGGRQRGKYGKAWRTQVDRGSSHFLGAGRRVPESCHVSAERVALIMTSLLLVQRVLVAVFKALKSSHPWLWKDRLCPHEPG